MAWFSRIFSLSLTAFGFPGLLRGHFLLGVAQRSVVNLHLLTFNYVLMKAVIILINCGTFSHYE